MKRIVLALVALGALALADCQTSQASSGGWGQIAQGVGQVIGETKYDAKVAKASEQLAQYSSSLQAVVVSVEHCPGWRKVGSTRCDRYLLWKFVRSISDDRSRGKIS